MALASCAPQKSVVIEEEPKKNQQQPVAPALVNDGLRLPDMTALPDAQDLNSVAPLKKEDDATILISPPTE